MKRALTNIVGLVLVGISVPSFSQTVQELCADPRTVNCLCGPGTGSYVCSYGVTHSCGGAWGPTPTKNWVSWVDWDTDYDDYWPGTVTCTWTSNHTHTCPAGYAGPAATFSCSDPDALASGYPCEPYSYYYNNDG